MSVQEMYPLGIVPLHALVRRFSEEDVERAGGLPEPGWHEAIVSKCEERRSKASTTYFRVHRVDAATRSALAEDVCMLEGAGLRGGLERLALLGGARRDKTTGMWEVLDTRDVRRTRVRVHVRHEAYESAMGPRRRAQVTKTEGSHGCENSVRVEAQDEPSF